MSRSADLHDVHALVLTPSHDGKYFHNYVVSLVQLVAAAPARGLRLTIDLPRGESLVTRARNNAVAQFLAHPAYTHLFWIDADIGFSPEAAFRLLGSGHDVCAGVYPLKRENWPATGVPAGRTREDFEGELTRYTVNTGAPEAGMLDVVVRPDGFMALDEAPTGFMVIRRPVFERLIGAYPELHYVPDSPGVVDQGLHYAFFDTMIDPVSRRYLSEDYSFCRLWTALGGQVFVDANSSLSHQGAKTYRGDFAGQLLERLPMAVGAPVGTPMRLEGAEHLRPNPPCSA